MIAGLSVTVCRLQKTLQQPPSPQSETMKTDYARVDGGDGGEGGDGGDEGGTEMTVASSQSARV